MSANEERGDHRAGCHVRSTYPYLRQILIGASSDFFCDYWSCGVITLGLALRNSVLLAVLIREQYFLIVPPMGSVEVDFSLLNHVLSNHC